MHSSWRPHPASGATMCEARRKQDASSKGLSREFYDCMDGRRARVFQNGDRRKVRISRRLEDQPKIGLYRNVSHNVRIWINRNQERRITKGRSCLRDKP
jgi:hypothetical protein